MVWRLSLIMDRARNSRRLVSLVTLLTILSMVSIMVTDLRFYIDKVTERTFTGKKHSYYTCFSVHLLLHLQIYFI